ncbi:hypothetical protein QAD02_016048 [Eretmocerus hayati]|uniref:Uncharacterized protein n=1 Tax=Eretmocerus hayati TaxID=131215 RepID=A0ACC2PBS0_9HYME|nr:hypothetical protein QAD02_016048 [Eretmocerus hayati]
MYTFKPFVFCDEQVLGPIKPMPRSGHRVVCNETFLYSYGGYHPSVTADDPEMQTDPNWGTLFKAIWRFNFASKIWKRLPSQKTMPNELASNAVVLRGNSLIVHGGTGLPFGENCNNNVYICNLNTGEMVRIPATGDFPDPQYGQATCCEGLYLYTVAGTTGLQYTCDIHRFNLKSQTWESVFICSGRDQTEPKGRYRHEIAMADGKIYVFGGGTANEAFGFEEVPAFDTVSNRWLTLPTRQDTERGFPAARRCHGLVQYQDSLTRSVQVVISGGYDGFAYYDDMWKLDLRTLQWTYLQSLPHPMYFHSTALTPRGQMYFFGGITKKGEEVTRTADVHSVWIVIPKLSEICWEALNYYNPDLKKKSSIDLLSIGIPSNFVQRFEHESI